MEYPSIERPTEALRWAIEHLASMIDARRCMIDPVAPPLLRAAARQLAIAGSDARRWTVAKDGTRTLAGLDPEVGRAFDRLADRIEGKPTQSMTIERREARTPAECAAALSSLLAAHPHLADAIAPRLAALASAAAPHAATDALPIVDALPVPRADSQHAGGDRGEAPQRDAQGGWGPPSLFRANPESKRPLESAPQPPAPRSPSPHDDWDSDAGRAAAISAAAPEEDAEAGTELGIGPKAFAFAPGPASLPKLGPKARAKRDREYRVRVKAAGTEF